MKGIFFTLIGTFSLLPVLAQSYFNGWAAGFGMFKLKNNFSIQSDIQFRSSPDIEKLQTLLLRAGLNYNSSSNIMWSLGYAHISNRRVIQAVDGYMPEHRIWQQLLISQKIARFIPVAHRFRFEQRFIGNAVLENNDLKVSDHSFALRTRYFVRGLVPFNGAKSFSKGMFGALQNEVFLNVGNTSAVNGKTFDQNRFYVATGYRFCQQFDTEIGYMNQSISGKNDSRLNNHILQLACYIRL